MTTVLSKEERSFLAGAAELLDESVEKATVARATEYFTRQGIDIEQLADVMGLVAIFLGQGTLAAHQLEENEEKGIASKYLLMNLSCTFAAINQKLGE